MGYDHSCFDEQAGQDPGQTAGFESTAPALAQDLEAQANDESPIRQLRPLEARRLIWEGAMVLMLAPDPGQHQHPPVPPGLRVEISLNRPWGRELKQLVNDPAMPIICSEADPDKQRLITKKLKKLGFNHVFTIQPCENPKPAA